MAPTLFDEMYALRRKVKTLDNLSEREVAYLVSFVDSFLEEFNSLVELPDSKVQLIRHLVALLDPMSESPSEIPS